MQLSYLDRGYLDESVDRFRGDPDLLVVYYTPDNILRESHTVFRITFYLALVDPVW